MRLGRPGLTLGSWGQDKGMYENPAAVREGSGIANRRLHTPVERLADTTWAITKRYLTQMSSPSTRR